jgi:tetrahydromethanopterin S-methyltransferase subunit G
MSELSSEQIREVGEISEEELAELREEHEELEDLISTLSNQEENMRAIAHHIEKIETEIEVMRAGEGNKEAAKKEVAERAERALSRFDSLEGKLEEAEGELGDLIGKTQQTEEIMRNEVTEVEQ